MKRDNKIYVILLKKKKLEHAIPIVQLAHFYQNRTRVESEEVVSNDDQVFSSSDREVGIGYAKEDDENENDSKDGYVDALRVRLVNFDNEEEDCDYDENHFCFLGDVNSNPKSFLDDDDDDYDDVESSDKIDGLLRGMDCDDDDEMEGDC